MKKYSNLTISQVKEILLSRKYDFVCPHCDAAFDEDDYSFAWETGLCQYCYNPLHNGKE